MLYLFFAFFKITSLFFDNKLIECLYSFIHTQKRDKKVHVKSHSGYLYTRFCFLFYFVYFYTPCKNVCRRHNNCTKKIIIAENKGIKEPHKMSTNDLLNAINRYNSKRKSYSTRGKVKKMYPKFVKKQNILEDDLRKATMLQNMSHDDLKKIAELRKIKNHDILAKEDLI